MGGHTAWMEGKQEMDKVHDDVWALDIQTWQWEKVKKAGLAPNPRCNVAFASHKKRAILFGGITDQHGRGDRMFSTLHDDLYQFNCDSRRWYPVAVKAPAKALAKANKESEASRPTQDVSTDGSEACNRAAATSPGSTAQLDETLVEASRGARAQGGSAHAAGVGAREGGAAAPKAAEQVQPDLADKLSRAGVDKQSALYRAAARIQSQFRGYTVRKAYKAYKLGGKVSELLYSPALYGIDLSAQNMPKPRARSSAMMAVVGNTLWLFGGMVEITSNDIALDDLWALDLAKLDGWRCIKENTSGDVKDAFDSDSSSDGSATGDD
ncbi:hypothetical protein ABBQ32_002423 [Trebouxia sp. C0010 RCD-2024]